MVFSFEIDIGVGWVGRELVVGQEERVGEEDEEL